MGIHSTDTTAAPTAVGGETYNNARRESNKARVYALAEVPAAASTDRARSRL